MKWINFIHFYQPPLAKDEIIYEVVKSSYKPWVSFLDKNKDVKITLNITACLTQRLADLGYGDLLKKISELIKKGQIEMVESAAFHTILPLMPDSEIKKQIEINNQINKKFFGKKYQPQGFYLPEMAYSEKVAKIIKNKGYKYIILDEVLYKGNLKDRPDSTIKYQIKKVGIGVVFRDRKISQTFVPENLLKILKKNKKLVEYIITATDGELYGHRHWNWYSTYEKVVQNKYLQTITISEYLSLLKKKEDIKPLAGSWESTAKEIKNKNYYSLWFNPKNKIHNLLWTLAEFALKLNYKNTKDSNHFASRLHLEKGLASCTFWWASKKDFNLTQPEAWDPDMVEAGAKELLNSVRSLEKINKQDKIKAEKIFGQIRNKIWHKHWR